MYPRVSVVITTYNGIDTINRAIKSVLDQDYNNLEILVVDDNGLGTPVQIKTESIVKNYEDIIYIPHDINRNGSAARNTGIYRASGKYVALLDDDDAFREHKIKQQVEKLEHLGNDYGLCYTGMMIHFPNGVCKEQITNYSGDVFIDALMRRVKAQTSEFLFRKECAVNIGGFDESFVRHQDWEFFDRMAFNYKIAVINSICIDRYITKRNSASNPIKYEQNRLFYLDKMKPFIEKISIRDQKELYRFHYSSISKEFIKNRCFGRGMKYFFKCGNPILTVKKLMNDYKSSSLI